jgi:hypothetical protein
MTDLIQRLIALFIGPALAIVACLIAGKLEQGDWLALFRRWRP